MKTLILSGGSGTRLWPLSRKLMPKQFKKLFNNKSLFQLTYERNKTISNTIEIFTNKEQYFIALDQITEIDKYIPKFYLENIGKNTAAAIALSALNSDQDDILFITPSDHLIKDIDMYQKAILEAKKFANQNYLVTFGIKPHKVHTGYGYIEADEFNVKSFTEKPDVKTAENYLEKGNYYWNSGMFMFKAGVFLEELKKYAPEIYEQAIITYKNREYNNDLVIFKMDDFDDISVDYAVMEKSKKLKVIPSHFSWNDVGSFDSLIEEIDSDEKIEIDAKNNFVIKKNHVLNKEIVLVGVSDLIVVDTPDALLITKKNKTQKVKDAVNILKKTNKEIIEYPTVIYRPWGSYEILINEEAYKIKRIVVNPGKRLSLQKHFHRSEHWIIVSGTALVTIGDKEFLLRANESTYIKMGEVHRLSNPGKIPVVLIEAQVGEYLGEDDIIRIEDDFNR